MNLTAYMLDSLVYIGIFAILALSFNLEYGFTGLPNFGKVAFFMVGAYASSLMSLAGLPYAACFILSFILAGITGVLISLPALKLRAIYLAIILLLFAETFRLIFKNEMWIAGGPIGLKGIPSAFYIQGTIETILLCNLIFVYAIFLLFAVVTYIIINSPYGRIMRGIRENELVTKVLGKKTWHCKLQVLFIGSAMAGAAGSIYSQYMGYVGSELFLTEVTFTVIVMSIIGGVSTIEGAIIGAGLLEGIRRGTRILKDYMYLPIDPNNLMFILTGILLVLIMLFKPTGLLKEKPIKTIRSEV